MTGTVDTQALRALLASLEVTSNPSRRWQYMEALVKQIPALLDAAEQRDRWREYFPLSVREGLLTPEEWHQRSEEWLAGLQRHYAEVRQAHGEEVVAHGRTKERLATVERERDEARAVYEDFTKCHDVAQRVDALAPEAPGAFTGTVSERLQRGFERLAAVETVARELLAVVHRQQPPEIPVANEKFWACTIGPATEDEVPSGADGPMRVAVGDAFAALVGHRHAVVFSGWGAHLTQARREFLEHRTHVMSPDEAVVARARAILGMEVGR